MLLGGNTSEILTVSEPAIELGQITVPENDNSDNTPDTTRRMGYASPFIKINGYALSYQSIGKFKLSTVGFRPTINIVFSDTDDMLEADFPKDGDTLELYIRSSNDNVYKKIRIDFDILNIKANPTPTGTTFNINGIMKIPDLQSEISMSLLENTSYNHLIEVADALQLGFASNITDTDDTMNRFNAKNTVSDFIKNITDSSYKDDVSFLTSYVDIHYYMNFVEVNSCFQVDGSLQEGDYDAATFINQDKSKDPGDPEGKSAKVVFSNHLAVQSTTNYIMGYSLYNNSGEIWQSNGYKRYCEVYNMDTNEYSSIFVDPLTTEGAENTNVILKGKAGDTTYENQNKYKYFGRNFSTLYEGNLHPNYHYAKIQNYQNLEEINKMGLTIVLNGISSNISKFRAVPVAIYKKGQLVRTRRQAGDELANRSEEDYAYDDGNAYLLDEFLSGWYVVKDFDIVWSVEDSFKQVVTLVRREWPMPNAGGTVVSENN